MIDTCSIEKIVLLNEIKQQLTSKKLSKDLLLTDNSMNLC